MLDNEITLPVDETNTGVPVDHIFTRFDEYTNRSVYIGENHSLDAKDNLTVYRTFPKVAGNFRGVAKTAIKFSTDITVLGADGVSQVKAPIIAEISFSVPVGATGVQRLISRQRAIAILDRDDIMENLMNKLMI